MNFAMYGFNQAKKFLYAENFICATPVLKAAEIIRAKKSKILFMKDEESLKGSSSPKILNEYEHRHISARPEDVEEYAAVTLTFSDGTKCLTIAYDKEPQSGFDIAYETVHVIYAAYLSADEGRRIDIDK